MPRVLLHASLSLCLMAGLFCSSAAQASEVDAPASDWTLRGFGTLGAMRTTSSDIGIARDLSQPKGTFNHWSVRNDSNVGLQFNYKPSPSLELVAQIVSRYRYNDSFTPEPTLAFAKWEPNASLSLRLGRVGADIFMLADSRLIGYSYLPVRPPQDYFGPLFFSHLDGGDINFTHASDLGVTKTKLFAGRISEKAPNSMGIWDTSGSLTGGIVLDHQNGPWRLRGSITGIRFSHDIDYLGLADNLRAVGHAFGFPSSIAAADALSTRGTSTVLYSTGIIYDDGSLTLQGMLNHMHYQSEVFQNSSAGFLLAGYRIGKITPYIGFSRVNSSFKNHSTGLPGGAFDPLNSAFAGVMAATTMDHKTWILGTRWDFHKNMALKAQWDAIRGNPDSRFLFFVPGAKWDGKTDVFSLSLDFIF